MQENLPDLLKLRYVFNEPGDFRVLHVVFEALLIQCFRFYFVVSEHAVVLVEYLLHLNLLRKLKVYWDVLEPRSNQISLVVKTRQGAFTWFNNYVRFLRGEVASDYVNLIFGSKELI